MARFPAGGHDQRVERGGAVAGGMDHERVDVHFGDVRTHAHEMPERDGRSRCRFDIDWWRVAETVQQFRRCLLYTSRCV